MIEWIKYDPANPPPLYKMYLICTPNTVISAWLDKNPYSENLMWVTVLPKDSLKMVTHYAHINLPEVGEETDNA